MTRLSFSGNDSEQGDTRRQFPKDGVRRVYASWYMNGCRPDPNSQPLHSLRFGHATRNIYLSLTFTISRRAIKYADNTGNMPCPGKV